MLHYILQTVIFQVFFLIVYDLFLKKETFFNYNRLYLIGTSILSFLLPFIVIESLKQSIPQEYIIRLPEVVIGTINQQEEVNNLMLEEAGNILNLGVKIGNILLLGTVIALSLFIFRIIKIGLLIIKNDKIKSDDVTIVSLKNSNTAFSFFNYIFLGEQLKNEEREVILQHEQIHIKERHSIDLLLFEVFRILFWFNPMIYLIQNRISNLHEFIADEKSVKRTSRSHYYQNLLAQIFDTPSVSFVNTFFKKSLIKKRIIMLSKTKSKKVNVLKYALLIPMVIAMLVYTSCSQDKKENQIDPYELSQYTYTANLKGKMSDTDQEIHNNYVIFLKKNPNYVGWSTINDKANEVVFTVHKAEENVPENYSEANIKFLDGESYKSFINFKDTRANVELPGKDQFASINVINRSHMVKDTKILQDNEVAFITVDEVPVFPGCESQGTKDEMKKCFSKSISSIVTKNFNIKLAEELGLVGVMKISVFFKISETGAIKEVKARAPHPGLEEEAKRIVGLIPQLIPGKHNGKNVTVPYYLPIKFEIQE